MKEAQIEIYRGWQVNSCVESSDRSLDKLIVYYSSVLQSLSKRLVVYYRIALQGAQRTWQCTTALYCRAPREPGSVLQYCTAGRLENLVVYYSIVLQDAQITWQCTIVLYCRAPREPGSVLQYCTAGYLENLVEYYNIVLQGAQRTWQCTALRRRTLVWRGQVCWLGCR